MSEIILTGDAAAGQAVTAILQTPMDGKWVAIVKKRDSGRTPKQNNALHVGIREWAKQMNDAGFTQRTFWEAMKVGFDTPITETFLKDSLNTLSGTLNGEEATHKLNTKEMQYLFDVFQHGIAQSMGIEITWPSNMPPMMNEREIR